MRYVKLARLVIPLLFEVLFIQFILLLPSHLYSQKRYLVTPNDEVIPMSAGKHRSPIDRWAKSDKVSSGTASCGTAFAFGYFPTLYPEFKVSTVYHKEVAGMWFVAKASGTIDSIYWEQGDVGALDSTLYLRISRSNIGPDFGPGIRPGPYNPPCQSWGYWNNTNDLDRGVAAFEDAATDTAWVSTYNGPTASSPPFDAALLPGLSFAVRVRAFEINHVSIVSATGGPLYVQSGDKFFISFSPKSPPVHTRDNPTDFLGYGIRVDPSDESYPSRIWKFYEHDSAYANCAGVPANLAKRGWVARGGFSNDSLDVAVMSLWYLMTPTENVGPDIQGIEIVNSTLSTSAQLIRAEIRDCDFATPARAGVKSAALKWQLNGVIQSDIPMAFVGGLTWNGMLPGESPGSAISYKVYAEDSTGSSASTQLVTYRIVATGSSVAQLDTSGPCISKDISGNPENAISFSDFYLPPGSPPNASALDDGTAGPFDIGSNMPLFGDVGRYLWIGINGGVAISMSATDTVDVNAGGQFTKNWSFPYQGSVRHGGRSDPDGAFRMPGNFFAPLWTDLWSGDSVNGSHCGHIRFQKGYGGDTCQIIVEWDSVGLGPDINGNSPYCSALTFRAIFNKCDGTIEYQYNNTDWFPWPPPYDPYPYGVYYDFKPVNIGFEADSTSLTPSNPRPSLFINESGYPLSTIPASGACFKIFQATINTTEAGWNLLSVGVIPLQNNYAKTSLYPTASTAAFAYTGSYTQKGTLRNGEGYWMKYPPGENAGALGALLQCVVDSLRPGWNLLGSAGFPVSTSNAVTSGGASLLSAFIVYSGGYHNATTLRPGNAFWVNSSGSGTLTLCSGNSSSSPKTDAPTGLAELNAITITDKAGNHQTLYLGPDDVVKEALDFYELPPAPPEFDARFASQRMLETYPAHLTEKGIYEYPIRISAVAFPVTISWSIIRPAERTIVLRGIDGKPAMTPMAGTGKLVISDASVKEVVVSLENISLPKEFALHQNFPNPFNPTTTLRFDLPVESKVRVTILNILGQVVTTLREEDEQAGFISVEWNASNVASGLYFCRLEATSVADPSKTFAHVMKMLLVK